MLVRGIPCLGPVTHAGCGAICPAYNRGCYGCFGPMESPNTAALSAKLAACGMSERDLQRVYSTFNVAEPSFSEEAARHGS